MKTSKLFLLIVALVGLCTPTLLIAQDAQHLEEGYASWYGQEFAGRLTANGEVYDPNQLTAAHLTLPFGTLVKVTNLQNGRSVNVRVTDRGPFIKGRNIDLSRAAAEEIAMVGAGVARVRIEAQVLVNAPARPVANTLAPANLSYAGLETRTIQIASYANREYAQKLVQYFVNQKISAEEEIFGTAIYRVVVRNIGLNTIPELRNHLAQLGYSDTLIRLK